MYVGNSTSDKHINYLILIYKTKNNYEYVSELIIIKKRNILYNMWWWYTIRLNHFSYIILFT